MRLNLLFTSLCCLLAGCNSIPNPGFYEYSDQKKMQAAHHWNVLAQDVANKINNELIRSDFLNAAVYVKKTCGSDAAPCEESETSHFNEGFRDLLVTQLVGYGIPTKTEVDRDVLVVDYKVQIIVHGQDRIPVPRTGVITGLTTTISVLRNAPSELLAITLAGAYDFYNTVSTLNSNSEVIITTSMVSKKEYIFRSSDIYYINDSEFWHYKDYDGHSQEIQLTSSNSPRQQNGIEGEKIPDLPSLPAPQELRDI